MRIFLSFIAALFTALGCVAFFYAIGVQWSTAEAGYIVGLGWAGVAMAGLVTYDALGRRK